MISERSNGELLTSLATSTSEGEKPFLRPNESDMDLIIAIRQTLPRLGCEFVQRHSQIAAPFGPKVIVEFR
jgi:hypothetical protein